MTTQEKLHQWIQAGANRGIHFSWLGQSYNRGVGIITATENGGEIVDFEMYTLIDVPVFKRAYARSSLYIDNTTKQKAVESILARLENTTLTDAQRQHNLTFNCSQLLDVMLSVDSKK